MSKVECLEKICHDIIESDLSEENKNQNFGDILSKRGRKLNVLVVGAAGVGKSSTINALLASSVAKVGTGAELETQEIAKYESANFVLWDTPGFSNNQESGGLQSQKLIAKLGEVDETGRKLIDLVFVVLDASSRDLGTTYDLINKVIVPHFGVENANRILLGLNQADIAMKGRNWDYDKSEPNQELVSFLQDKVRSVRDRALEATGIEFSPFFYSAGFCEDDEQASPYNLSALLSSLIQAAPLVEEVPEVEPVASVITQPREDASLENVSISQGDTVAQPGRVVAPKTVTATQPAKDASSQVGTTIPPAKVAPHLVNIDVEPAKVDVVPARVVVPSSKVSAAETKAKSNAKKPLSPPGQSLCCDHHTTDTVKRCSPENNYGCLCAVLGLFALLFCLKNKPR